MLEDLKRLEKELIGDQEFLTDGEKAGSELYNKKLDQGNVKEDKLFALGWDVEGYKQLLMLNTAFVQAIINISRMASEHITSTNIRTDLGKLRKDMLSYLPQFFTKLREAANHLLLFLIADEKRMSKPYSILVRAFPFSVVTHDCIRRLRDELRDSMISIGMVPVGFVTDGEWNSLRTMGSERPISVIQLLIDSGKEATSTHVSDIEKYLTINKASNQPEKYHPAVPISDVLWLKDIMKSSCPKVPFEDAIHMLKRKQFPSFYEPYPWKHATPDDKNSCLKSIMAQYIYRYKTDQWKAQDVDFVSHPYVPEFDKRIGEYFHEREDHGLGQSIHGVYMSRLGHNSAKNCSTGCLQIGYQGLLVAVLLKVVHVTSHYWMSTEGSKQTLSVA